MGEIQMGTVKQVLLGLGVGAANLRAALKKERNFLRFFEREIPDNILWLEQQIRDALDDNDVSSDLKACGYDRKRIVVTPLVMDFDKNLLDTEIGGDVKSVKQFERLVEAIHTANSNIEIYPFAGLALNKLDSGDQALADFQEWWNRNSLSAQQRLKGKTEKLMHPGKAIGIKLYPPLGFNPYPEPLQLRKQYLKFFQWCVDEDIPITVHCQESSFTAAQDRDQQDRDQQDRDQINKRTHPRNWERLLKDNPQLSSLRINFGHFGGSKQFKEMLGGAEGSGSSQAQEQNWTMAICRLLCQYPNTYADISAFGLEDDLTCNRLAMLFGVKDSLPEYLSGLDQQKICDKIIWGSDLPMVISSPSFLGQGEKPSYLALLNRFRNGMRCQSGSDLVVRNAIDMFNRVTRTNPANFLFGSK